MITSIDLEKYLALRIKTKVAKKALQIIKNKYNNITDLDFSYFGDKSKKYYSVDYIYYKDISADFMNDKIQLEYEKILEAEVNKEIIRIIDTLIEKI